MEKICGFAKTPADFMSADCDISGWQSCFSLEAPGPIAGHGTHFWNWSLVLDVFATEGRESTIHLFQLKIINSVPLLMN